MINYQNRRKSWTENVATLSCQTVLTFTIKPQETTYSYWGIDHSTTSYGKLWEIKTTAPGGSTIQDLQHTWDNAGNLTQRQDLYGSETENFTYDYLDRLTAAAGPYYEAYVYDLTGNLIYKGGSFYTYSAKPHAVTSGGSINYVYDNNGNMTTRGSQTLTWDVENLLSTVSGGSSYIYDGDGNRVKEIESSQTTIYVNQYFEKNLTTGEVTTH